MIKNYATRNCLIWSCAHETYTSTVPIKIVIYNFYQECTREGMQLDTAVWQLLVTLLYQLQGVACMNIIRIVHNFVYRSTSILAGRCA